MTQHKNSYINQHIPICIIFGNSHNKILHVENQPRKEREKKKIAGF